jgi:hypothetical protein
MPQRGGYRRGQHLVNCSRCSMSYYESQTAQEWTGDIVCKGAGTRDCYEPRSSIDFIRSVVDQQGVQNARTRNNIGLNGASLSLPSDLYVQGGYMAPGYVV